MAIDNKPPFPWPLLRYWSLRILPIWLLIAALIFLVQLAVCAMLRNNEQIKIMLGFIDMLPGFVKAAFGGEMLQAGNLPGLIAMGYQHPFVMLLYMLFSVGVPTGLLAGEVQKGTMELILSRYVSKIHVYICAGFITITGMFALVLVMFSGTIVAINIYDFGQKINLYPFFKVAINGGILASAVGGVALMTAACFRRNTAVWITVAYLVISYFISIFSEVWHILKYLKPLTVFYYVNGPKIFNDPNWPLSDMSVLLAVLAVSSIIGGLIWHRRDLPL